MGVVDKIVVLVLKFFKLIILLLIWLDNFVLKLYFDFGDLYLRFGCIVINVFSNCIFFVINVFIFFVIFSYLSELMFDSRFEIVNGLE